MKNQFIIQCTTMFLVIMSLFAQRSKYTIAFVFNKWELDFVFDWQNGKWVTERTLDYESNHGSLILAPSFTV